MASQHHNEDETMSMIIDAERLPLSFVGESSTLAGTRPSVPNDKAEHSVRQAEDTGSGQEENGDEGDLDDDRVSKNQESTQRDEAQQRSSPSVIVAKKGKSTQAEPYEIKTDELGNEWFCAEGKQQKTVYHSDIRYDLEHYSEWSIPSGGPHYKSMLGAGTDDKTSYHPLFDFCGKERADRPDCLFYFEQPPTRHDDRPTKHLEWNGRVVLDYRGVPVRVVNLPLTISSKIGHEEARLEAMLRLTPNIEWSDIMARILRRGDDIKKAKRARNALNMRLVRFRTSARLISWDNTHRSKVLKTHLLTIMTAEMVVKNSTRLLADMVSGSDEHCFVELLNYGTSEAKSQKTRAKGKLQRADRWAQARSTWEAQNPIPAPSIYGETKCTAVEPIVAFKLASLKQHRRDGSVVSNGWFSLDHAAPMYRFDNPRMEEFFGSQAYYDDKTFLLQNPNDPYGLLSSPTITAAQTCIVDFLLEPARLQYRKATLVDDGFGEYEPIVMTNPSDSYWQQLHTLQSAFEQHWAELGRGEHPPVLHGLLKLDYDTMTWNTDEAPVLTLVWQSISSCAWTFAIWQRRQTEHQREKLLQWHRNLDDEAESGGGRGDEEGQDGLEKDLEEGDEDGVELKEGGRVGEEAMEVESEREEEL